MEGAWISIRQFEDEDKDLIKDSDGQTSFNIAMKLYDDKHNLLNEPMHDSC